MTYEPFLFAPGFTVNIPKEAEGGKKQDGINRRKPQAGRKVQKKSKIREFLKYLK
jgi:beta-lactam-binding protein with PASTA domain